MWIDIGDHLPAPEQEVLITGWRGDASGLRYRVIAIHSTRQPGAFYDEDSGDIFYPPTHWAPIPSDEEL